VTLAVLTVSTVAVTDLAVRPLTLTVSSRTAVCCRIVNSSASRCLHFHPPYLMVLAVTASGDGIDLVLSG